MSKPYSTVYEYASTSRIGSAFDLLIFLGKLQVILQMLISRKISVKAQFSISFSTEDADFGADVIDYIDSNMKFNGEYYSSNGYKTVLVESPFTKAKCEIQHYYELPEINRKDITKSVYPINKNGKNGNNGNKNNQKQLPKSKKVSSKKSSRLALIKKAVGIFV